MAQTRYIKGKNGRMLGSIGGGKQDVPTAGAGTPAPMLAEGNQPPATATAYERFQAVATPRPVPIATVAEYKRAVADPNNRVVVLRNDANPRTVGSVYTPTRVATTYYGATAMVDGEQKTGWVVDFPKASVFTANDDGTFTHTQYGKPSTYAVLAGDDAANKYVAAHRAEMDAAAEAAIKAAAEKVARQNAARDASLAVIDAAKAVKKAEYEKHPDTCRHDGCTNPLPYGEYACEACQAKRRAAKEERRARLHVDETKLAEVISGLNGQRVTLVAPDGRKTNNVRLVADRNGRAIYQKPRQRTNGFYVPDADRVTILSGDGTVLHAGANTHDGRARKLAADSGYSLDDAYTMLALSEPRAAA